MSYQRRRVSRKRHTDTVIGQFFIWHKGEGNLNRSGYRSKVVFFLDSHLLYPEGFDQEFSRSGRRKRESYNGVLSRYIPLVYLLLFWKTSRHGRLEDRLGSWLKVGKLIRQNLQGWIQRGCLLSFGRLPWTSSWWVVSGQWVSYFSLLSTNKDEIREFKTIPNIAFLFIISLKQSY